jgi:hypothetical protein
VPIPTSFGQSPESAFTISSLVRCLSHSARFFDNSGYDNIKEEMHPLNVEERHRGDITSVISPSYHRFLPFRVSLNLRYRTAVCLITAFLSRIVNPIP